MPREINHWWTTRPKRKLITIVDVLRVFLTVAEGKKWQGNRQLHLDFETALEEAGLKGVGNRRDQTGGGGRTYAAWLMSFGLWFAEDKAGLVHATFAGDDLLKGILPVPVLTEQILNFQYPSPFSRATHVNSRFKIYPFRFILRLLLDDRLGGFLTQNELAGCVLPYAERDADLDDCVERIRRYRRSGYNDAIFDASFENSFGPLSKIRDTANTFFNQLEYTQLIVREDDARISLVSSRLSEISTLAAPRALVGRSNEHEYFQRKYGLGPNHHRDNRNFGVGGHVSAYDATTSKVLFVLWEILGREPVKSIDINLINRISLRSGVNTSDVERIITTIGVTPTLTAFEQKYLQLSMGGTAFATDFEHATEGVFGSSGLGFETEWIGSSPNNPDVLAISLDLGDSYLGILDAKAYKEYTIIGDHRRRMSYEYIPKYKAHVHKGSNVNLGFFSYVAGGFGATVNRGIEKIFDETGVLGSAVTAQELVKLLKQHLISPYSKPELKRIFSLKRQILPTDFMP